MQIMKPRKLLYIYGITKGDDRKNIACIYCLWVNQVIIITGNIGFDTSDLSVTSPVHIVRPELI